MNGQECLKEKNNMTKTIYVLEFSREDSENESEWFVAEVGLDYDQLKQLAYKHLSDTVYEGYIDDNPDFNIHEEVTVEGVYSVSPELIKEVVDSYKEEK